MTRWNDYLANGNAVHHYPQRKRFKLSKLIVALTISVSLACIFATLAAEYTKALS